MRVIQHRHDKRRRPGATAGERPAGARRIGAALASGFCTLVLAGLAAPANATPLFEDDSALEIRLSGPLDELVDNKEDETPYPFTLTVGGVDHAITLEARGKSRLELCRFPPLRIVFTEPPGPDSPFFGQKRLKLVNHCRDRHNMEVNLLEEYAAYRIFNLFSPISYQVRLLDVTFKDDAGKLDGRHPAFAIEPTSALVERVGGRERELPGISRKNLNPEHTALVYVFHYLVGNTDWSLVTAVGDEYCCHNGKLMQKDRSIYLLPYDFDLVGLVNASYAIPAEGARIEKVTERSYRGYCMEDDTPLREAIRTSIALRPEIEKIFDDLPVLDEKDLEKDRKFIAKYFNRAENEDRLMREFRRYCID